MFDDIRHENQADDVSVNCEVCGDEHLSSELKVIRSPLRLSGNAMLSVCNSCIQKTAEDYFKDAADLLEEIGLIVRATSSNPERRLQAIKNLLEK